MIRMMNILNVLFFSCYLFSCALSARSAAQNAYYSPSSSTSVNNARSFQSTTKQNQLIRKVWNNEAHSFATFDTCLLDDDYNPYYDDNESDYSPYAKNYNPHKLTGVDILHQRGIIHR